MTSHPPPTPATLAFVEQVKEEARRAFEVFRETRTITANGTVGFIERAPGEPLLVSVDYRGPWHRHEPVQATISGLDGTIYQGQGGGGLIRYAKLFREHETLTTVSHVHSPHLGAWAQTHRTLPIRYVPVQRFNLVRELPVYIDRRQPEVDYILERLRLDPHLPAILEANGGSTVWGWQGLRKLAEFILLLEEGAEIQLLAEALGGSRDYGPGVLAQQYRMSERPGAVFDAVHPTTLKIEAGERYGLIGFSGAGKSTLLRLINGLETPSGGEVWIDGQPLDARRPAVLRRLRRRIGMVFQHFNLLHNRTVAGNVALPLELAGVARDEREARVRHCLEQVRLADRADHYPAQLSGGQKQRVAIARALAPEPRVLLCDEPTSALDPLTVGEVVDVLQQVQADLGLSLVLVSHSLPLVARLCERAAVMDAGRIVEELQFGADGPAPQTAVARRLLAAAGVAHV